MILSFGRRSDTHPLDVRPDFGGPHAGVKTVLRKEGESDAFQAKSHAAGVRW
jgi:hypothetical protein